MLNLAIILGSTRPTRVGASVADWVYDQARKREGAKYELIDLIDYNLPLLDEPNPPSIGNYTKDHTKTWSNKVSSFDGFIFVSPEYNHSTSGALKNAIDFLYKEWNNKAAGFVAYGGTGGVRAVESLRLICAELQVATVRNQLSLLLREDFKDFTQFTPRKHQLKQLNNMLDQLEIWSEALRRIRL